MGDIITLSNGHQFEWMAASGALAYDGCGWLWEQPFRWMDLLDPMLFTVVTKTLTFRPRAGNLRWYNPLNCIRLLPSWRNPLGVVNAVGMTNPGIGWWCDTIAPHIEKVKIPLVVSIFSDEIEELEKMVIMLNHCRIKGIEWNASCPNTSQDLLSNAEHIVAGCRAIKKRTNFPLILKLSVAHRVEQIVPHVRGLVEALSINSVPWEYMYPHAESPLAHLGGGGVSGKLAQEKTMLFAATLVHTAEIPVIGSSVWDYDDILRLKALGASAFSFGSIFLRYPWRPTQFVRRHQGEEGRKL